MTTYNWLAICMALGCVRNIHAKNSTSGTSTQCLQEDVPVIKVAVFKEANRTAYSHAEVNFYEASNTDSLQIYINHNSSYKSSCTSKKGAADTLDSPSPFYEFIPTLGYYKLHTKPKTWHEGKLICEEEGAHLAIINTEQEVEVLQQLRLRLPKTINSVLDDHLFLGINDILQEGVWKTIFNEALADTGFNQFGTNEPNGGTTENCGDLYSPTGKLNDAPCSLQLPFVCELEI